MLILVTRQYIGGTITEAIQSECIYKIKPYKDTNDDNTYHKSVVVTVRNEEVYSDETVEDLVKRIREETTVFGKCRQ